MIKTTINNDEYIVRNTLGNDVVITFIETGSTIVISQYTLSKNVFKDKMKPHIAGIGYIGIGEAVSQYRGRITDSYNAYSGMLHHSIKHNVKVHIPWLNFQVFNEWYELNTPYDRSIKYRLKRNNQYNLYAPQTCTVQARKKRSKPL